MDFTKLCRTCLKETDDNMVSIFITAKELANEQKEIVDSFGANKTDEKDFLLANDLSIMDMIAACSSTVSIDIDSFPKQICTDCIMRLYTAYTFRKSCENAFNKLKIILLRGDDNSIKPVKQDPDISITLDDKTLLCNKFNEIAHDLGPNEKCVQTDDSCIKPCEFCDMKFFNSQKLKEHRLVHKDAGIKCRICSKKYTRFTHLQRHIVTVHPQEFNISSSRYSHVCGICDKEFTRLEHLNKHTLRIHNSKPKVKRGTVDTSEDNTSDNAMNGDTFEMDSDNELNSNNHIEDSKYEALSSHDQNSGDNLKRAGANLISEDAIKSEKASAKELGNIGDYEDKYKPKIDEPAESENISDEDYEGRKKSVAKRSIIQKIYKCDTCFKEFTKISEFNKHKSEHKSITTNALGPSNSSKVQHQCFDCKKFYSRAYHLKRHMHTHSEERPYSCEHCGKRFNRADHLRLHRQQHSNIKPFKCEHCERQFLRNDSLRIHITLCLAKKTKTVNENKFTCEICLKSFQCARYLKKHSLVHKRKTYNCRTCGEKFETSKELSEHTKTHASERPYLCSECGLRFVRHDYLVVHMRRHKGEKPYKCRYCEKGFPRATDLTVHERYHTGEKTHLCTTCGKGFQRAYNLLVHTRVHTGERPYKCPHCTKSFAQGNDLKAHVRRHTGERYKCDICGDGFIQGYHLTQHKRNKHGIDTKSQISRLKKFIPTIDGKPVPLSALSKTSDEIRSVKLKSFKLQLPEQLSSQQSQQISEIIQIDDSSHASASLSGSGQQISSPFQVSEHNIKLEPTINIIENEAQSTDIISYQQDHQYHHPIILSAQNLVYQPSTQYQSHQRDQQSFHSLATTEYIQPIMTNIDSGFVNARIRSQSNEKK